MFTFLYPPRTIPTYYGRKKCLTIVAPCGSHHGCNLLWKWQLQHQPKCHCCQSQISLRGYCLWQCWGGTGIGVGGSCCCQQWITVPGGVAVKGSTAIWGYFLLWAMVKHIPDDHAAHIFVGGAVLLCPGEKWTIQHKDVIYQLVISTTQRRNCPLFSRTRLWLELCTFLSNRELFCRQLLKVQKMDFLGCEYTKSQKFLTTRLFWSISAFQTLEYTWKPESSIIHPLLLHLDWLVDNCKDGWRFTSKFLLRWWWDVHPLNFCLSSSATLTAITVCCRLQSSLLVHSMTAVCHYMTSWLNRGTNSKKSVKPSLDALGTEIKCW